jgi:hypothetical protein
MVASDGVLSLLSLNGEQAAWTAEAGTTESVAISMRFRTRKPVRA